MTKVDHDDVIVRNEAGELAFGCSIRMGVVRTHPWNLLNINSKVPKKENMGEYLRH